MCQVGTLVVRQHDEGSLVPAFRACGGLVADDGGKDRREGCVGQHGRENAVCGLAVDVEGLEDGVVE